MEEKEIWLDIPGYENYYQVSNLGRVKRLQRLVRNGYRGFMYKERILKDYINIQGYHCIKLSRDGERKNFLVHRIVYAAFMGEIPEGFEVNHLDECKDNNSINNLNLMTRRENINWGTRTERASKKRRKKILMDDNFEFDSITKAAEYLGCSAENVSMCCRNITHNACGHTFRYKLKEESKQ